MLVGEGGSTACLGRSRRCLRTFLNVNRSERDSMSGEREVTTIPSLEIEKQAVLNQTSLGIVLRATLEVMGGVKGGGGVAVEILAEHVWAFLSAVITY